ncbi:hypothetical protein [Sinorhizobium mexicanum]|uniref:hypothetical protein n=1 Tax=Sinorhizobium mexicanum TaxID=375549 RepID=UPI0015DEB38C|nr:hypothetical protein [Sinorhizobium mexicanum]MBP1881857.1 hypothetical protein [Sinorhizobium mexicanum]
MIEHQNYGIFLTDETRGGGHEEPFRRGTRETAAGRVLGAAPELAVPRQFPSEHIQGYAPPIERQTRLLKGRWRPRATVQLLKPISLLETKVGAFTSGASKVTDVLAEREVFVPVPSPDPLAFA